MITRRTTLALAAVALSTVLLILFGCSQGGQLPQPAQPTPGASTQATPPYTIISSVAYNNSLCGSTGYGGGYSDTDASAQGFSAGLRVLLKDKVTGETVQGAVTTTTTTGSQSGSGSTDFSCMENLVDDRVLVHVAAEGYAPVFIPFNYPKNQLVTLEIPMSRSCSGGPGYLDNARVEAVFLNNTDIGTAVNEAKAGIAASIQSNFGLNDSDYTLTCLEADMGRGGFIRAKGSYKDGSPLGLYYHWGWCSSGGADCGWSSCLNTTASGVFDSVKSEWCGSILSTQTKDGSLCSFTNSSYDRTNETRNRCRAGDFETHAGQRSVIAIRQAGSRCGNDVVAGEFNC